MSTKSLPFSGHLANIEAAAPAITAALDAFSERAKTLADKEGKRQAPQEALAAFAILRDLKKKVEESEKAIGDALKAHLAAGGPVEAGEYALSLTNQERISVKWEEVAEAAARSFYEATGKTFHPATWKADIKAATAPTPVQMLKVVKVAGAN